ncbi:type II secretion system protein GspM [Silanimonas lenta]|uniref:type II secretion system protein GspM n=1 Tax=Silanimonas lenta TaxID=265429 RepID=UPI0004013B90|nr:type II secretion system protein GspM [Silanimonas lenta]
MSPEASPLQRLHDWFDARQPRERLLASVTVGVLGVAFLFLLLIEPAEKRLKADRNEIESLAPQVEQARASLARLEAELAADPEAARRAQLARLQAEATDLDGRLRADQARVIPPARMPAVLRELLGRDARLRVLGVEVLPPEVLRWTSAPAAEGMPVAGEERAAAPAVAGLPALYRHRVVLRFEGEFDAVLAYLKAVEALPYRLALADLAVEAEAWPRLRIRLEVETLGLEEGWIGV